MKSFIHPKVQAILSTCICLYYLIASLIHLNDVPPQPVEDPNFLALALSITQDVVVVGTSIKRRAPTIDLFVTEEYPIFQDLNLPGLAASGFDKIDHEIGWVVDSDHWLLDRQTIVRRFKYALSNRKSRIASLSSSMVILLDRWDQSLGCKFRPEHDSTGDDLFFLSLGFKQGDLITEINFTPVFSPWDVWREFTQFFEKFSGVMVVVMERDGKRHTVSFELDTEITSQVYSL